jgi:hypothetical protein
MAFIDPAALSARAQVKGVDVFLTVEDMAAIYCLKPATITWKCRQGIFHPLPARKYPYRWRKSDVEKDIATQQDDRYAKHGFATKKYQPGKAKPAKAKPAKASPRRKSPAA